VWPIHDQPEKNRGHVRRRHPGLAPTTVEKPRPRNKTSGAYNRENCGKVTHKPADTPTGLLSPIVPAPKDIPPIRYAVPPRTPPHKKGTKRITDKTGGHLSTRASLNHLVQRTECTQIPGTAQPPSRNSFSICTIQKRSPLVTCKSATCIYHLINIFLRKLPDNFRCHLVPNLHIGGVIWKRPVRNPS